jgi:hypothetical protein
MGGGRPEQNFSCPGPERMYKTKLSALTMTFRTTAVCRTSSFIQQFTYFAPRRSNTYHPGLSGLHGGGVPGLFGLHLFIESGIHSLSG